MAMKVPVVAIRVIIEIEAVRVTLEAVKVPIEDAVEATPIKVCRGPYSARRS